MRRERSGTLPRRFAPTGEEWSTSTGPLPAPGAMRGGGAWACSPLPERRRRAGPRGRLAKAPLVPRAAVASAAVYPIFVVLLDGLADRAHDSLGGRTANEAGDTPNLDRLAAGGSCGLIYGVGPGPAPSSELAHWALLGYTPEEFPGRPVLEALGAGHD